MRRFLPQTLPVWVLLIVIAGLLISQVATLYIVSRDRAAANDEVDLYRLNDRAYSLVQLMHDDTPDQRKLWFDDFEANTKTAVEEIVRFATPVIHFRRTVTQDTELSGQQLHEGDKVVLWYNSANRDERVFDNPFEFNIQRSLQPVQTGFGAGGPHFCLGANLARREISVMFDEIRTRLPNMRITGEPAYLQSFFINGIKRLPCSWS